MTVDSPDSAYKGKSLQIKSAVIVNFKGDIINIEPFMTGFAIFEDLMKKTMTMQIGIVDGVGLVERLPIVGDEIFILQVSSSSFENDITVQMPIYAVYDKQKLNDTTTTYVLDCVSFEYMNSLSRTADRAYSGLPVTDMVRDIYETYLKSDENKKPLIVDQSVGNHNFIAPETDPFEFIDFLAHEAVAGNESANYIFYETRDNFNFRTLNRLYRQEPTYTFIVGQNNIQKKNTDQTHFDDSKFVEGYTIVREMDTLNLTQRGYYDNSVLAIDPLLKRFTDRTFTYSNNFDQIDHLSKNKSIPDNSRKNLHYGASRSKYFVSHITDGNYYQEPYLQDKITSENDKSSYYASRRWLTENKRMAIESGLDYLLIDVDVPGNPAVKVGDIVNLLIPADTVEEELKGSYNPKYGDEFQNAKFLVQRICHRYNKDSNEFITSMRLSKDTVAAKITAESDEV